MARTVHEATRLAGISGHTLRRHDRHASAVSETFSDEMLRQAASGNWETTR